MCSVYAGHQSVLIPPAELEVNPALWLLSVSQFKVRDTFCSYSVMELCTKTLGTLTDSLKVSLHTNNPWHVEPIEIECDKHSAIILCIYVEPNWFNMYVCAVSQARGLDLSRVRTCVVVAEERPRISLTQSFSKLFKDVGLHPRAVSTAFGCRINLAVCLQVSSFAVSTHRLVMLWLRVGKVCVEVCVCWCEWSRFKKNLHNMHSWSI